MSNLNLPVKQGEEFMAEAETMDLGGLKDKTFLVAVSTGDRNKSKFLSTTAYGPYTFPEMVEQVGMMWNEHQHHAKVVVMEKDRTKPLKSLDENTTDYIECHWTDIAADAMLEGILAGEAEFTCQAGFVEADIAEDPTKAPKPALEEDDDL
jgi:hypothetical protein